MLCADFARLLIRCVLLAACRARSSGVENVHYVSRVTSGVRHALTIAFTCDASKSVEAKLLARADDMLRKQALAQARAAQTAASETNSQPPSTQEPATPVAGDAAPPARP